MSYNPLIAPSIQSVIQSPIAPCRPYFLDMCLNRDPGGPHVLLLVSVSRDPLSFSFPFQFLSWRFSKNWNLDPALQCFFPPLSLPSLPAVFFSPLFPRERSIFSTRPQVHTWPQTKTVLRAFQGSPEGVHRYLPLAPHDFLFHAFRKPLKVLLYFSSWNQRS